MRQSKGKIIEKINRKAVETRKRRASLETCHFLKGQCRPITVYSQSGANFVMHVGLTVQKQ